VIKLDPEHKKIALSIKEHLIDTNAVNRDDIVIGKTKTKKKKKEEVSSEDEEQPGEGKDNE
jgi:small subunit ribosomal protein S1